MTFAAIILRIPVDLCADNHAKVAESVIKQFLVNFRVQVADEQVCPNILSAFVLRCFVDFDGFSVQFYHVHDLDRVICVFFTLELDEAEALMLVCDLIARNVDIHDRPTLGKQLP